VRSNNDRANESFESGAQTESVDDVAHARAEDEASDSPSQPIDSAPLRRDVEPAALEEPEVPAIEPTDADPGPGLEESLEEARSLLHRGRDASLDRSERFAALREARSILDAIPEAERTSDVIALHKEIVDELTRLEIDRVLPR